MTFSFKGPTRGLPTREQFILNVANVKTFGSHTVLWLFSHFQFLLYDGFTIRLRSVFFFPMLCRTCMKFFYSFSEKGEAGGRAKSKEKWNSYEDFGPNVQAS